MEQYNKYVRKWQDATVKMNEAIQSNDFETADMLLAEATENYNRYKECTFIPKDNQKRTFGELNYMLESNLPQLFKTNKKAIKECMDMIKNDNNLLSQFKFIDALRKYNCNGSAKEYVNESINFASKNINLKTVKESNKKFANLLAKYEIGGEQIDEDSVKYFNACASVLTKQKSLKSLMEFTTCVESISDYVEKHKAPINESKVDINKLSESLDSKIKTLTEEEKSIVQDILDFKQPQADSRKSKMFNTFKNECITKINELLEATESDDEKEGLNALKENIEKLTYCAETIVTDIAKLLEMKEILNEKY